MVMIGDKMRRMNRRGSIEGLPLYMTMMVVISAASIAILSGWFSGAEYRTIGDVHVEPEQIILEKKSTPYGYTVYSKSHFRMVVTVTDDKGNPIKDASVTLTGMGIKMKATTQKGRATSITPHALTDSNGIAVLYNLYINNAYGPGEITVKVTYGHGGIKYVTVPVGVNG